EELAAAAGLAGDLDLHGAETLGGVQRGGLFLGHLRGLGLLLELVGVEIVGRGLHGETAGHTRRLFDIIAQSHGKSSASVERAMQHAITRTWNTVEIDVLLENYHGHIDPDKANPTVMEFIAYYANQIRNGR
ncbi:MAG: hypothetical protein IIY93_07385, partial [Clostridia bacterium]|nr:hypothetical protein [Clostridia bacterium]